MGKSGKLNDNVVNMLTELGQKTVTTKAFPNLIAAFIYGMVWDKISSKDLMEHQEWQDIHEVIRFKS